MGSPLEGITKGKLCFLGGRESELPTRAQSLGYTGRGAEVLSVFERRCFLASLGLRVW